MEQNVSLLIIGNEVLTGKISDQNGPYIAKRLWEVGSKLSRIVVVPDIVNIIANEVKDLSMRFDSVITSGGIGPTHDDVTMEGVAKAFDTPLVKDKTFLDLLGAQNLEGKLRMASIPAGARLISTNDGTFPLVCMNNVYMLPGVPILFRKKFDFIVSLFVSSPFYLASVTFKASESEISKKIEFIQKAYPEVQIGSYPKLEANTFIVVVTIEGKNKFLVDKIYEEIRLAFDSSFFI